MLPEFCRPRRYPRISAGWDCNTFWRMAALAIFQNGSRTTPQSQAAAPDRWRSRIFDARIVVYPIEYDRDLFACIESPTRKQTKRSAREGPREPRKKAAKFGFKMICITIFYTATRSGTGSSARSSGRTLPGGSVVRCLGDAPDLGWLSDGELLIPRHQPARFFPGGQDAAHRIKRRCTKVRDILAP